MSAGDNELDYLDVPRGPVDEAITHVEKLIEENAVFLSDDDMEIFEAIVVALRELQGQRMRV